MAIEKKILTIFRVVESLPELRLSEMKKRLEAINALLTNSDRKVMADVVRSMLLLTAGNQKTIRDPSQYDASNINDTFAMMMNTKMYRITTLLKLPIEYMTKPTQADYVLAKKLLPIMGSASIGRSDIDTHVGKLSNLDRRFKSEGYDVVYRGLNRMDLNTISYLMDEPSWDMKRGVSTSYDVNESKKFAKTTGDHGSEAGPAVLFEISNESKRGFHADTLSRYEIEKEVILSGEIKITNVWVLQAYGKIMPADPMEPEGDVKITFNSRAKIAIFNWVYARDRENIKTIRFPNEQAFLDFCQESIINESGLLDVNDEDWEFEIYPNRILLKVQATLP